MPAHGHTQCEQKHHNNTSQERSRGPLKQCENVVHVHQGGMREVRESVDKTEQVPCKTRPVKAGCSCTEVKGDALIEHITMPEAKKALVLRADFNASMSLAHVQDEGGQTLTSREKREALTDIGQGGVRGFVRQTGMTRNPAD